MLGSVCWNFRTCILYLIYAYAKKKPTETDNQSHQCYPWAQSGDPYFFNKFEQQAPERLLNLGISNEFYQNPKTPSTLLPPDVEPQSHLSVHPRVDDLIGRFCQLRGLASLSDKFMGELQLL